MDIADDREGDESEEWKEQFFRCRAQNCQLAFQTKEALKEHAKKHEEDKPKVLYRCQVCTKTFSIIADLVAHRKTHPTPTGQKCGYCRTEFPADVIAKHVIECALVNKRMKQPATDGGVKPEPLKPKIIVGPDEKLFKCGVCGERFADIAEYRVHFQTH